MDNQTKFFDYEEKKHTLQEIIPVPSRLVRIPDSLDRKVECLYTFCMFLIFPKIPNLIKDYLHKGSD